jgi:hypothetical protein
VSLGAFSGGWVQTCHICNLGIEMRYRVAAPRSTAQGYWAHLDTVAGIAANEDHAAIRGT